MIEQNTKEEQSNAEIADERNAEEVKCLCPVIISAIVFLAAFTNDYLERTITLCFVGSMLSLYGMGRYFVYKLKN